MPNPRIANLVRAARANLAQKPFAFIKSIDKKDKSSSWVWPSIKK
ncbi:Protein of unknown function [Lactobacillus delbrueckii subsp. lactis]|nr:Protein of unknown function [Lactobacillus delbrueckii subsp. lactis]